MSKFRFKYEYVKQPWGSPLHIWSGVCSRGAVHLHITDHGTEYEAKYGDRYSGGFEVHYATAPDGRELDAPDHDRCPFISRPCWHDGSSTYAREHWIPLWQLSPHDHDAIFTMLGRELEDRFASPQGDEVTHD